jgi:(p)ppGpp synthase/HD superfamily hydrolase
MKKDIVKEAKELAKKLHEGMTDKYGNPYFEHLERVADRVRDMEYNMVDETSEINLYLVAAYLHDSVEDTEMELFDIESKFGKDIAVAIDLLTRKEGMPYSEYVERIRRDAKSDVINSGKIARVVKLADLFDHLMGPTPCPPNLIKRYEKSLYTLIGSV